jgi:hypothetical protein
MMRIAAMAGAAALLAGCNGVMSTTPLFSAEDAKGQPQLRSGVWMAENASCAFDASLPLDRWPGCSDGFVVRPGVVVAGRDPGSPPSSWNLYSFVLAKGDPAVLQITEDDGSGAPLIYLYAGLKSLKLDPQHRVIEYKVWPALCGPPPPDGSDSSDGVMTQQPIEGLVVDAAKHDCVASAQAPVLVSVQKSEAWNGDANMGRDHARWVRDGER